MYWVYSVSKYVTARTYKFKFIMQMNQYPGVLTDIREFINIRHCWFFRRLKISISPNSNS